MKKTLKLTSFCLAIIMMVLAVLPLTAFAAESEDVSQTQTLEVENYTIHNMTDNRMHYFVEKSFFSRTSEQNILYLYKKFTVNTYYH